MLPVLLKVQVQDLASLLLISFLGLLIVGYAAYSGWRGALGKADPKTGRRGEPTREDRLSRAGMNALVGAAIVGAGLYFAVPLHTYGLMLASGLGGAVWMAAELARKDWTGEESERKREQIYDLAFWVAIAGVGGSMLLFRLINWRELPPLSSYLTSPAKLIDCVTGGLVFYGGLIGATLASVWFARRNKLDFLRLADIGIPTVSFGQALGRLGCFSAGCCWGDVAPASFPLGVHFPGPGVVQTLLGHPGPAAALSYQSQVADNRWVLESTGEVFEQFVPGAIRVSDWVAQHGHTLPLHPTQLYESFGQILIFLGLIALRRYKRFHGQIFGIWLMAYAILRSTVELFRGDLERGTLRGLLDSMGMTSLSAKVPLAAWYNISTSQFISICMFALGATVLWRKGRHLWVRSGPPAGAALAG